MPPAVSPEKPSEWSGIMRVNMLIRAVAEIKGYTLDVAKQKVLAMSDDWRRMASRDPYISSVSAKLLLRDAVKSLGRDGRYVWADGDVTHWDSYCPI